MGLVSCNGEFDGTVARATAPIAQSDDEAMRDIVEEERPIRLASLAQGRLRERGRPARNPSGWWRLRRDLCVARCFASLSTG